MHGIEDYNEYLMLDDPESDAQAAPFASPSQHTNYTHVFEDPRYLSPHDASTISGARQDEQSHHFDPRCVDSRDYREEFPDNASALNSTIESLSRTHGFPSVELLPQPSQLPQAAESVVGGVYNLASTPDMINGDSYGGPPFLGGGGGGIGGESIYAGSAYAGGGLPVAPPVFPSLGAHDGTMDMIWPAAAHEYSPQDNHAVYDDGLNHTTRQAACDEHALSGYDNGQVPIQHGMMYTSGALVAGEFQGAVLEYSSPSNHTWSPPASSPSDAHGAHVGTGAPSTSEAPTSTPAMPSAPTVPAVAQPPSQDASDDQEIRPFTEWTWTESGGFMLLCPCGDAFSSQRGAAEQHYDEKHAKSGQGCPWKIRGCENAAQDVKGHIRDKHCLTLYHCPTCLRCDFTCERSMMKHSGACKKPQMVVCGACRLPWWGWASWVEHAMSCTKQ